MNSITIGGGLANSTAKTIDTIDTTSIELSELKAGYVYVDSQTGGFCMLEPETKELRAINYASPVNPDFVGSVDFRDLPDLTTLGLYSTCRLSINESEFVGELSGKLSADKGLTLTEIQSAAWKNVLSFRKLGAKVTSGKKFSVIMRVNGGANIMTGLLGMHNDLSDIADLQSYSELSPSVYYRTASNGQIYRPYLGSDDDGYDVASVTFLGDDGETETLDSMNNKWFRLSMTGMGVTGSTIEATEIDIDADSDLFSDAVKVGETLTRQLPSGRGNTSDFSCFGIAINAFVDSVDIMAISFD